MANRGAEFDRSQSFIGNFSVLEGVMVKISDKFRPPKQVALPDGWHPVEIKKFELFDFTFEEDVIKMAEEEKLQEEREQENAHLVALKDDLKTQEEQVVLDYVAADENSDSTVENAEVISDINEAPILVPMRIENGPSNAKGSLNTPRDFNFSEFEDTSATPFELVELQTLDDIDELMSVLQPDCDKKKKNKKRTENVPMKEKQDEIDFSIFNRPIDKTKTRGNTASSVATASLLQGLEPDQNNLSRVGIPLSTSQDVIYRGDFPVQSSSNSFVPVERHFESLNLMESHRTPKYSLNSVAGLASTTRPTVATVYPIHFSEPSSLPFDHDYFNNQQFVARGSNNFNEFRPLDWRQSSDNVPGNSGKIQAKPRLSVGQTFSPGREEDNFCFERTNLNKSSSRSLPNLAEPTLANDKQWNGDSENETQRKSPNEFQNPVVSTSRIDNIMKKFQLDRLREFHGASTNSEPIPIDHSIVGRPLQRNGALPALQTSSHSTVYQPFVSLPQDNTQNNPNLTNDNRRIVGEEVTRRTGHLEPLRHEKLLDMKGSDRDSKLSFCEPLPPITTPSPPRSPKSDFNETPYPVNHRGKSWLPDPSSNLSANEKALVNKISFMGFPKARLARTVLRLRDDEKEIIDFLVQVQQYAELGYDEDDVEMALLCDENEGGNILSYLNLANKWKELGFPVQKIHDALKNTDKENEAVFEYLTS